MDGWPARYLLNSSLDEPIDLFDLDPLPRRNVRIWSKGPSGIIAQPLLPGKLPSHQ